MILVRIYSTFIDSFRRRVVKGWGFSKSDVRTAFEAGPYGVDSNPIRDMVAVYADTHQNGRTVIVGYINKNQIAGPGEMRLYSTDSKGTQKFYTWMKDDGTYEIGGSSDNMVRYAPLNSAIQAYLTALNTAIAAGITSAGGAYTPPSAPDLSSAKINSIKTLST